MYTCQVRPFSSASPKIAQTRARERVYMFACLHLGISYICTYCKSHNFIATTGCVSHQLSSWPISLQSFVLMSFSHDIQTSSCLKPPDPFMLCLCHCKQQQNDSGGGVRFGPQIFLMGSLKQNKQGSLVFLCTKGQEESTGRGPDPF